MNTTLGKHQTISSFSDMTQPLFNIIYNSVHELTIHHIMDIHYNKVINNIVIPRTLILWKQKTPINI